MTKLLKQIPLYILILTSLLFLFGGRVFANTLETSDLPGTATATATTTTQGNNQTVNPGCSGSVDACEAATDGYTGSSTDSVNSTDTSEGDGDVAADESSSTTASSSTETVPTETVPSECDENEDNELDQEERQNCKKLTNIIETGCVELGTSIFETETGTKQACGNDTMGRNAIMQVLVIFLQFLTGGIGVLLVGVLIYAGLQYMTARGNPQAVSAAKMKIFNAVIGFALYLLATAIMNFIIPGGLF